MRRQRRNFAVQPGSGWNEATPTLALLAAHGGGGTVPRGARRYRHGASGIGHTSPGRSGPVMKQFRQTFRAMASDHEIQLAATDMDVARRAAEAAIADVRRIEAKYSRYRDDSVTTRINRAAGDAPVPVDAETAALLRYADQCHALSRRALRHHVGRAAPRVGLQARPAGAAGRGPSSPPPSRTSAGPTSSGTKRPYACRAPAWRSTSAASARNTRPIASRRSSSSADCATGS